MNKPTFIEEMQTAMNMNEGSNYFTTVKKIGKNIMLFKRLLKIRKLKVLSCI
jgi:hypothetical protein